MTTENCGSLAFSCLVSLAMLLCYLKGIRDEKKVFESHFHMCFCGRAVYHEFECAYYCRLCTKEFEEEKKEYGSWILDLGSQMIEIGPYMISEYPTGGFWIERGDGEGMQVSESSLVKLLDKFFKENF